jgi:hypothetical protein
MGVDSRVVSDAVVVWTGFGSAPSPSRDEQRLTDRYGRELSRELLPALKSLEDEFYSSDAKTNAPTLVAMGEQASAAFRVLHPEISDEAVRALAWCYTFDFK